jgi:hypothetical protein
MEKNPGSTYTVSVVLSVLLLITLAVKWELFSFIWPSQVDRDALIGSAIVTVYLFGTLLGVFGLLRRKSWGCIVLDVAVVAGTFIGVSVIPFLAYIVPPGFARTYAVIGINLVVIILVAVIHIRIRRRNAKGH